VNSLREELETRQRRARDAVGEHDLDGLLVIGGPNLSYLSGFPGLERTMARGMFLVMNREGGMVLVTHTFRFDQARRYTPVDDIRSFQPLTVAPIDVLRNAFEDLGLTDARVGIELGYETQLNIPVGELDRIRASLPDVKWTDAARLLWELRFVKSNFELARARRAGRLAAQAIGLGFASAAAGTRVTDLARQLRLSMLSAGAGDSYAVVVAGSGEYDLPTVLDPRPVERGDLVFVDAGCAIGGYWMEHSRAAVVGGPSSTQSDMQHHVLEATLAGVREIGPGVPLSSVAHACNQALGSGAPSVVTSSISGNSGRCGHSFGMEAIEPPHVSTEDPTILQPGMVLAIEPGLCTEFGRFHVRHNVLVTSTGHEVLECPDWRLGTIDA
jgi:Xaa-Pro aminopeptidase